MSTRNLRWVIVLVSAITAAVLFGVAAFIAFAPKPEPGKAADFATAIDADPWGTDSGYSDFTLFDAAWTGMNEAINSDDRAAFLSYAADDATEQLSAWWDESKKIGWDHGYIQPLWTDDSLDNVLVGLELPFTATPVRSSGQADAGKKLLHGSHYAVTTTGSGDDLKITSFVPAAAPNPWDTGSLYVRTGEHVTLFGLESERELVDANLEAAEEAAAIALNTANGLGAEVPQRGFISAITADPERFSSWGFGNAEPEVVKAAAVARPTVRPAQRSDLIDPEVATGRENSALYVVMGPGSADQLMTSFVHEFAHVLHFTGVPDTGMFRSRAAVEGFARFMEVESSVKEQSLVTPAVQALVAERGEGALSDELFDSADAAAAYDAAGSYYAFVAEQGGDPWALAVAAKRDQASTAFLGSLALVGSTMDPAFSAENWIAWVQQQ